MPRLPRIHLEGAVYYVTSKGLQDRKIFMDNRDSNMYLELLTKYKGQHKFKLFSYCLLPDRIQLLIETGDDLPTGQAGATISDIMHDLTSLYTKYYNGRYDKRGHLFESRFKSMLVEKSQYLLAVTRQIHLASGNPKEYPYSSFLFYVSSPKSLVGDQPDSRLKIAGMTGEKHAGMTELDLSAEIKEVKDFLLNKDDPNAYEKYCLEAGEEEVKELEKSLRRGSVLGSEKFRQEVGRKVEERSKLQEAKAADEGADKLSRVVYLIAGAAVLVLSSASVYLYFGKQDVEKKYLTAVKQKEAEFVEKTKFENQSPIVPSELEGTEWEVEILGLPSGRPEDKLKDKIRFQNGSFFSQVFEAQGFRPTRYVLIPQAKSSAAWQCAQGNPNGETIRWQGQWRGGAMKGSFSFQPAGGGAQVFSFFSTGWRYAHEKTA